MTEYNLKVTGQQAQVIMEAVEILARLGMGQFMDALGHLPLEKDKISGWHDDMLTIGAILRKHTKGNVDGWQSSLGISSADVSEESKTAWDLYQVVRKKLSWEKAVDMGYVADEDSPRNWDKMMGVNYDDPMRTSLESLAEIELKG